MKCPNCQSENSDTAKLCKKCGTALNTEPAPNSHESMVKSMNEHKSQNNNTKIIIVIEKVKGIFYFIDIYYQNEKLKKIASPCIAKFFSYSFEI